MESEVTDNNVAFGFFVLNDYASNFYVINVSDLYECLAGRGFEYAHNSYIVNLAKVEGLEKNVALLPFGIQLNVSRSRKGQFADALITFLGERNGMV